MADALQDAGIVVDFFVINATTGAAQADDLLAKCRLPVLQDVDEVKAWELMDGVKDDFYVYGSDGKLAIHLPAGGAVSTNLSTDEGWNNLYGVLVAVD